MNKLTGIEFHTIIREIFGNVKNYGKSNQVQVCCPVCSEELGVESDGKFNLEINTKQRVFHCWKCDEPKFSGSLGRLIKIYGDDNQYSLYKSYAQMYGDYDYQIEDNKEFEVVKLPDEFIPFSKLDATNKDHYEAYCYMTIDRKISRDELIKYGIGFCVDLNSKYYKRIIIPSKDKFGEINYFVARSYDSKQKKYKYMNPDFDKTKIIFNEGYINWDSCVYLVEGTTDFLSLPINTIPLLGKEIHLLLLDEIKKHKPYIIIVLDPDAKKSTINNVFLLKNIYGQEYEDKIRFVILEQDNRDVDEIRCELGKNVLIEELYKARDFSTEDFFINKLYREQKFKQWGSKNNK